MSAPDRTPPVSSPTRLAELLMSAAATLSDGQAPDAFVLAPPGVPVRDGRLHLGRIRSWLPIDGEVAVVTGFGTATWLGRVEDQPPGLGRHVYRLTAGIDRRGRLVLDRRSRAWLAVEDAASFEAVTMPLTNPRGVLLVPVEGYAHRLRGVML